MMEWWEAVVLGVVEGVTEYLPVSSTGHLILTSSLLGLDGRGMGSALNAFEIVIQGGAILAVLGLYWPRVVQMLRGVVGKDAAGLRLAVNLGVAFVPAAVLGVLLDDVIDAHLFRPGPVVGALAVGGVYMIVVDRWCRGRRGGSEEEGPTGADLGVVQALVIGLMQCVAMWPGTSRSMMTITGGMLVGMRPRAAAEFSFLLGLPTLGGATVYKALRSAGGEDGLLAVVGWGPLVIGLVSATVSAVFAVRWLVSFLTRHGLTVFGWYRLALAGALLAGVLVGVVRFGPEAPAGVGGGGPEAGATSP